LSAISASPDSGGSQTAPRPASLARRLAAIAYDGLLLFSVLFVAAIPLTLMPDAVRAQPLVRAAIQIYFALVSLGFFGGFWVHGGQTLGMRAWRLRVVGASAEKVSWKQAVLRYVAALLSWACAGLGFLWAAFDREGLAWHDRLSGTRLVYIPKR
jgi:uncharacterized RDD family membrane protein YckC